MPLFEPLFAALNAARVRYVVVGGRPQDLADIEKLEEIRRRGEERDD